MGGMREPFGSGRYSPLRPSGTAHVVVNRLARACLAISPRARAWLLAGFLAANLVGFVLVPGYVIGLWGYPSEGWVKDFDLRAEGFRANTYESALLVVIAVLAVGQCCFSPRGGRWGRLGWLSVALMAALQAYVEIEEVVDIGAITDTALTTAPDWTTAGIVLLAAPLVASAGWAVWSSQRDYPVRLLLTGVAVTLAVGSVLQDSRDGIWDGPRLRTAADLLEEGMEIVALALAVVVLTETLLHARPRRLEPPPRMTRPRRRARWLAVLLTAVAGLIVVATGAFMLLPRQHVVEHTRGIARPWSYTGPIWLVEQRFRAAHDYLHRIDVWTYVDVAPGSAEVFARLTPVGSDTPIRESRAEVDARRFSDATASFHFEPIPDSSGTLFTLTVGVLSGTLPYVFVGLTDGDVIPEGAAVVSGASTPHGGDLAIRTAWVGRYPDAVGSMLDPQRWVLIAEAILLAFLGLFAVVATWRGLSGSRTRFWRRLIWPAAATSALIVAGIVIVTLSILATDAPTRLA